MEIIIISGRSGAGKSVALRALEDMGYYCVDNLPLDLLPQLTQDSRQHSIGCCDQPRYSKSSLIPVLI